MTTQIKEYSQTEAAIADLTDRLSIVPDYDTSEGYKEGEVGRKELKGYRISLEKKRKELGEEARTHLNLVNSEAKPIHEALVKLEQPFIDAKKHADEAVERIKTEAAERENKRIEHIDETVRGIRALSNCSRTPEAIAASIETAERVRPDDPFYEEFAEAANFAKKETLEALYILRDEAQVLVDEAERVRIAAEKQAVEQKKLNAEREAMERHKAEQQAVIDAQTDELAGQKAELQAEKDKIEEARQAESEKKRQEEVAKADKLRREELKKEHDAKVIADREKFADDEAVLVAMAGIVKITIETIGHESLSLKTNEARTVALNVIGELKDVGDNILNSAVVKSQQG